MKQLSFFLIIIFLFSCKLNDYHVVDDGFITELKKFLKNENSLVLKEISHLQMTYDFREEITDSLYKDSIERVESLNTKELENIISLHGAKYEVSRDVDNILLLKENYLEKLPEELIKKQEITHKDSLVIYQLSELVTNAGKNFYFLKFTTNHNTSGYFIYFPEKNKFVKTNYDNFINK